jgi:ribonuclease J
MVHHAELAVSMGLSPKHVLICEDGDQIEVAENGIRRAGKVPAGFHYIDGSSSDLDERPLEERRMLAEYGVILISAGVDKETATIAQAVAVSARGWFEGASDAELLVNLKAAVRTALQEALADGNLDPDSLSKVVQRAAGRLLGQRYRRQPVILPAVVVL